VTLSGWKPDFVVEAFVSNALFQCPEHLFRCLAQAPLHRRFPLQIASPKGNFSREEQLLLHAHSHNPLGRF